MYELEYLPIAKREMADIAGYISNVLHNPAAAEKLSDEMVEAAEKLTMFPYSNGAFVQVFPFKQEYRRLIVRNYIMFYYIDEAKKLVTVARVIYARRDYGRLLD